jgi:outer membrane protein TolC
LWVLAIASALPWNGAQGQTLIDALVSTYNTNPDLLAQRARLRVVDELVSQAQADARPMVRSQGKPGIKQQSGTTSPPRRVDFADKFVLEAGGPVEVKGNSSMPTWFAEHRITEVPNTTIASGEAP